MPLNFSDIPSYCQRLVGDLSEEKNQMEQQAKMHNLDWDEKTKLENQSNNIKVTISPAGRNKSLGVVRLLTTREPSFSIPRNINSSEVMEYSDDIERIAKRLMEASDYVTNNTAAYDILLSLAVFGQTHYSITRTKDLVANARGKEAEYRFGEIQAVTPVVIDVYDPRKGYVDRDRFGVRRYYREVETTWQNVADEFGEPIPEGSDPSSDVTLCNLWTWEKRWVWIMGEDKPIKVEDIDLFPVGVTLGEGSTIFDEKKYHGQPFGYTLWETGMWKRENLMWTATMTLVYNLMMNGYFISEANPEGEYARRPPDLGGDVKVPHGAQYGAMDTSRILPPQIFNIMQVLGMEIDKSTIYDQTLGAPLGKNEAFSTVALLHQAGRLPLSMFQRKGGRAIADVMKTAMRWVKDDPPVEPSYEHIFGDFDFSNCPEHYHMIARLEAGLPQDNLESSRVAAQLTDPKNPKVSNEWAMENILAVKQPKDEVRRIYKEQAIRTMFEEFVKEKQISTKEAQEVLNQIAAFRAQAKRQGAKVPKMNQPQPGMQGGGGQQGPPGDVTRPRPVTQKPPKGA